MTAPEGTPMRRLLVTGGAGFIGSHVADALAMRGDAVIVLDNLDTGTRDNIPDAVTIDPQEVSEISAGMIGFIEGSILDSELIGHLVRSVDGIIHLAAIASVQRCQDNPALDRAVNFDGLRQIMMLSASRDCPCAVIFSSSAAVYGEPTKLPITEDDPTTPISNYGKSKLDAERLITEGDGIVPSTAFRFFNVYGPRQDPSSPYSGVISIFIARALDGLPLRIDGDGEQSRDFIHVSDIVRGLLLGLDALLDDGVSAKGHAKTYNLCSGNSLSILDLIDEIEQHVANDIERTSGPARLGDIRHSLGSHHSGNNNLGFECNMAFSKGLGGLIKILQSDGR